MRIGARTSVASKPGSATACLSTAVLAALFALSCHSASAQIADINPDETAAAKPPAKTATATDEKTAATKPAAAPSEDLPWLATTTPGEAVPAAGPATPSPAQPPSAPTKATPAKPGTSNTATSAQKCEELQEDGCRSLKSCAWVAAMPAPDGKMTPARCAERKVFAPEAGKKPKTATAKPKPKPEKAAAAPVSAPDPVKPISEPKQPAKPEPAVTEAAGKPQASPPPAQTDTKQQPGAEPVETATPATSPVPNTVPAETAVVPAPAAQTPTTSAVAPPTMLPRGPVPFLPPQTATPDTPIVSPRSEAAPASSAGSTAVASGADEQPAEAATEPAVSIPGLIVAD